MTDNETVNALDNQEVSNGNDTDEAHTPEPGGTPFAVKTKTDKIIGTSADSLSKAAGA